MGGANDISRKPLAHCLECNRYLETSSHHFWPEVWKALFPVRWVTCCPSVLLVPLPLRQNHLLPHEPLSGRRVSQTPFHRGLPVPISKPLPHTAISPLRPAPAEAGVRGHLGFHWKKNKLCRKINTFLKSPVVLHSRPNSFPFFFFLQIPPIFCWKEKKGRRVSEIVLPCQRAPRWPQSKASLPGALLTALSFHPPSRPFSLLPRLGKASPSHFSPPSPWLPCCKRNAQTQA